MHQKHGNFHLFYKRIISAIIETHAMFIYLQNISKEIMKILKNNKVLEGMKNKPLCKNHY